MCSFQLNTTAGSVCNFLKNGGDEYTIYLQFYMLFMLFWVANFIVALGQMTLAGAFASYYWAFSKPSDIPAFPVSAALWRSLRYGFDLRVCYASTVSEPYMNGVVYDLQDMSQLIHHVPSCKNLCLRFTQVFLEIVDIFYGS